MLEVKQAALESVQVSLCARHRRHLRSLLSVSQPLGMVTAGRASISCVVSCCRCNTSFGNVMVRATRPDPFHLPDELKASRPNTILTDPASDSKKPGAVTIKPELVLLLN